MSLILRGYGRIGSLILRGYGGFVKPIVRLVSQIFAWIRSISKIDNIDIFSFRGAVDLSASQESAIDDEDIRVNSPISGSETFPSWIAESEIFYSPLIEE